MFNPMADMQGPSHHGSAEQRYNTAFDMGGGIGQMTPPISPRRTTSPRSRPGLELPSTRSPSVKRHADDGHERRRSRERYRQRHDNDEQPLPQSWGARMLATETKVRTLEESLESVKKVIEETRNGMTVKVDQMKGFVQEVEGRFTQLERAVPERFHALEVKEETTKILINELATSIRLKFNELEESIKARPAPPIPPSFGGSAHERPEHFHVGSPLSAPTGDPATKPTEPWVQYQPSTPGFATHWQASTPGFASHASAPGYPAAPPPPASTPNGSRKPWDFRMWSVSDVKTSKELKPFDGSHAKYKTWANRVKDHFKKKHGDWSYVFDEVEKQKFPITRDKLVMGNLNCDGYSCEVDFSYAANSLWTFIGENVADSIYNNRNVLAGGMDNGLEMWRALFVKHQGGAHQVKLGGIGSLHSFPQCDTLDSLQF